MRVVLHVPALLSRYSVCTVHAVCMICAHGAYTRLLPVAAHEAATAMRTLCETLQRLRCVRGALGMLTRPHARVGVHRKAATAAGGVSLPGPASSLEAPRVGDEGGQHGGELLALRVASVGVLQVAGIVEDVPAPPAHHSLAHARKGAVDVGGGARL